jgi:hypothetical protein
MAGLPFVSEFIESAAALGVHSGAPGQPLPAANSDIDVLRIELDKPRSAPGALGGNAGRASPTEWVKNDPAAVRAVADRICDKSDRLYGCAKARTRAI